ncbi:MAG: hypothetical protein WC009_10795 [Methylotenera sp.]|jgi:starvation-inducible outer membrane lipoprotein
MMGHIKKIGVIFVLHFGMAGCASAPPPPECKGEFKPVNKIEKNNAEISSAIKLVRCGEGELHGNKG